jgi:hypothetical protein
MNALRSNCKRRGSEKNTKGKRPAGDKIPLSDMIHSKIKKFSSDNPDASEYYINTEAEAGELLVYMAAACELLAMESKGDSVRVKALRFQAGTYKGHFKNKTGCRFIANEVLTFCGLRLVSNENN